MDQMILGDSKWIPGRAGFKGFQDVSRVSRLHRFSEEFQGISEGFSAVSRSSHGVSGALQISKWALRRVSGGLHPK